MNARTLEPIHVLVADDELPARQRLIDLLRRDDQVASVSEAADGEVLVGPSGLIPICAPALCKPRTLPQIETPTHVLPE